jgi:Flp pilus assembly pilin Flp
MRNLITRLYVRAAKQDGQALSEYAIILALVVVVCIALLTAEGADIQAVLTAVNTALATAV